MTARHRSRHAHGGRCPEASTLEDIELPAVSQPFYAACGLARLWRAASSAPFVASPGL